MLFTSLGWSVCLDHYPRPQAQFFPIQTSHLMNHTHTHTHIYIVYIFCSYEKLQNKADLQCYHCICSTKLVSDRVNTCQQILYTQVIKFSFSFSFSPKDEFYFPTLHFIRSYGYHISATQEVFMFLIIYIVYSIHKMPLVRKKMVWIKP